MGTSVLTQLTLIIPVYNGEPYLPATFRELEDVYRDKQPPRIIFVNDGSVDATPALLRDFSDASFLSVRIITIPINKGKGNAIRHVIETGGIDTPFVGFTDVEIPYSLEKVEEAVQVLSQGNYDMVIADRTQIGNHKQYAFSRKIMTTIFRALVPASIRSIRDTQSGLKLFRTAVARRVFAHVYTSRWVFDIELFLAAAGYGARIYQLPVKIKPSCVARAGGVSLFRHAHQIMRDIVTIYMYDRQGKYRA